MLEIKDVTKRYGKIVAVDSLSLEIPDKTVYALLGPNGAGKTTTLGMCCGLIRPTRGDVFVNGKSIRKEASAAKKHLGLLVQGSAFYPDRTGHDHLVFYGKLSGVDDPASRAGRMLKLVGLEKRMHDPVRKYSHGMIKLLNLAQALLAEPDIVFLDEPIAGLDPKIAYKVKDIIKQQGKKRTIVLSSHYLEAVEKLCSHVAIMDQGRLLKAGKLKDVRKGKSLEKAFLRLL
ncbi:ABC transporter ATP-binding protein [Candidatus Woesearchaeota archaeon]|nr:ABC transporter ATP-binding protein [Candidatus Woesearchaeota archaeon]